MTGDGRHDLVVMSGQSYAVPNLSVVAQQATAASTLRPSTASPTEASTRTASASASSAATTVSTSSRASAATGRARGWRSSRRRRAERSPIRSCTRATTSRSRSRCGDVDLDGVRRRRHAPRRLERAGVYAQHVVGGFAGEDLYAIPYASHTSRTGWPWAMSRATAARPRAGRLQPRARRALQARPAASRASASGRGRRCGRDRFGIACPAEKESSGST